jgi:very-short-patch-repair endonuclease
VSRPPVGLPHPDSPPELKLWELSVLGWLPGWRFNYRVTTQPGRPWIVVDLAEPTLRLAAEVDGRWHAAPEQQAVDAARDAALAAAGWQVRRYPAREVLADPEAVADDLAQWAEAATQARRADQLQAEVDRLRADLDELRDPRRRTARLIRSIGVWLDGRGHSGADFARAMNAELLRRFGPAADRTAAQHRAALDYADRWRADAGIARSQVEP